MILKRLIQLLRAEYFSFYMANEKRLGMDDAITIYANQEGGVNFCYKNGAFGKTVIVRETSIGDSVHHFVDFAEENDWFYGRGETIERMKRLVDQYSM